jgi:hypothetical protein
MFALTPGTVRLGAEASDRVSRGETALAPFFGTYLWEISSVSSAKMTSLVPSMAANMCQASRGGVCVVRDFVLTPSIVRGDPQGVKISAWSTTFPTISPICHRRNAPAWGLIASSGDRSLAVCQGYADGLYEIHQGARHCPLCG